MRYASLMFLVGGLLVVAHAKEPGRAHEIAGRWSREKANQWYAKQPWPCGFNYVPANAISDPRYGKQPDVVPGWYANGWTPSPGHGMVRDPKAWPRLERYVKDIVASFKDDPRVWVWDLYNEPTNSGLGDASLPLVHKVFTWARSAGPSQPLTVGRWNGNRKLNEIICQQSDVITFHQYANAKALQSIITGLKKYGRPVICTEWMARTLGSRFKTHLPIFLKENVGCMHWGLVNGKTQTHYAWGSKAGAPEPKVWFVDLYRKDHTPYDPKEIDVLKQHISLSKTQKQSMRQ